MATPVFSPLSPRWCGWCQQPLQGRANKRFCSAVCRNMAARHGETPGGPVDWQARAEHAEQQLQALQAQLDQQAQARQAGALFEQHYEEFPHILYHLVPELPLGTLPALLAYVEQVLATYAQHPGLAQGEAGPQQRLQTLQTLQALIVNRQYLTRPFTPADPRPGDLDPKPASPSEGGS
jgi:hypothetical protein